MRSKLTILAFLALACGLNASAQATAQVKLAIINMQEVILKTNDGQKAVEYGAAHGALASTTPGDTSMATRKEVEKTISGGGARVVR